MLRYILGSIFGRCLARCNEKDLDKFIDVISGGGITTDPIRRGEDGFFVTLPQSKAACLLKLADEAGIACEIERLPGLPLLFKKYRRRPGILVGAALFFFVIWFSGRIIWGFEITGNKMTSDIEIISALEELGCGEGAYIPSIDFDQVQNDCLIDSENLAWVSVNMDGNLARVEVREKRKVPVRDVPQAGKYANIVAAEDGVIELCRVRSGNAAVEKGDIVRKGELLISGVIDVKDRDVRYEHAEGDVMARVRRTIESYVPYNREVNIPTGKKSADYTVKIFGNEINLPLGGRIDYELYGTIEDEKRISLPFGITLPVRVSRSMFLEYRRETENLAKTEALRLAREDAAKKLNEMAGTLQLLSVEEFSETGDSGATVRLTVYGIADISANYGFSAGDTAGTDDEKETIPDEENNNG